MPLIICASEDQYCPARQEYERVNRRSTQMVERSVVRNYVATKRGTGESKVVVMVTEEPGLWLSIAHARSSPSFTARAGGLQTANTTSPPSTCASEDHSPFPCNGT